MTHYAVIMTLTAPTKKCFKSHFGYFKCHREREHGQKIRGESSCSDVAQ
jgi:hypothetical protein